MNVLATAAWVIWAAGFGLLFVFLGLVAAAWWAMFSDRSRGRRRCPKCWHDLAFSPGMTCGECGFAARAERDFARTRRRTGVFLMSILGCSLVGVYVIDYINTKGWMSYVPTSALITILPVVDGQSTVSNELVLRMRGNSFDEDHWISLLRRSAKGDGAAAPPDDAWLDKYGTFASIAGSQLRRSDNETLREESMSLILDIACARPPAVEMGTRERWPPGISPTLNVFVTDWWNNPTHTRILARAKLPGATADAHVCRDAPIQARSYSMSLPPLETGEYEIDVDVTVERRLGFGYPWVPAGESTVTVPISVGSDALLRAVSGEAFDRAIRRTFGRGLTKWDDGSLPVRVGVNVNHTIDELFDDTAVAVEIEVIRNEQVGRRLDIWWRAGRGEFERQHAWEVPVWNDEILGAEDTPNDEWMLRVTGSPALALRIEGVTKYWSGQVTMPVRVRRQTGGAPARGWIADDESTAPPVAEKTDPI